MISGQRVVRSCHRIRGPSRISRFLSKESFHFASQVPYLSFHITNSGMELSRHMLEDNSSLSTPQRQRGSSESSFRIQLDRIWHSKVLAPGLLKDINHTHGVHVLGRILRVHIHLVDHRITGCLVHHDQVVVDLVFKLKHHAIKLESVPQRVRLVQVHGRSRKFTLSFMALATFVLLRCRQQAIIRATGPKILHQQMGRRMPQFPMKLCHHIHHSLKFLRRHGSQHAFIHPIGFRHLMLKGHNARRTRCQT